MTKGRGSPLAEICGNKRIVCLFTLRLYGERASPVRLGEILAGKNGKVLISKVGQTIKHYWSAFEICFTSNVSLFDPVTKHGKQNCLEKKFVRVSRKG